MNPLLLTDFYKIGHVFQYPKGTNKVYSNFTARKSRIKGIDKTVFFGLQYFIKKYLIEYFNHHFFSRSKDEVVEEYKRVIQKTLGGVQSYKHIEDLHDLGYLPLKIKALPEGSLVNIRVPYLTITNTKPEFYWLTNFIETLLSTTLWQPITSATIAYEYKKLLTKYAKETGMDIEFVQWQGHDFSFRGLSSLESGMASGMAHLLSFSGTDTIPGIIGLEKYYNANIDSELVGASVPATEHSVMCAGGDLGEVETIERLITEVYPEGILSIVSDTWDLWRVCNEYLPNLSDKIKSRNGKVVVRPDSGDPIKIICGDPDSNNELERKGVVQILWDKFGGIVNEKGFKVLDDHIGVIYGDSITVERAEKICQGLKDNGFASQAVFGIGSFTYQYNTRDTFGMAMKSTYVEIDGVGKDIFKDPITDSGEKSSAVGLLKVQNGSLFESVGDEEEKMGELKEVFKNGELLIEQSFSDIKRKLSSQ